jgi:RHS repeat-associated protein
MRSRWISSVALVSSLVLIGQIPAQPLDAASAPATKASVATSAPASAASVATTPGPQVTSCTAKPVADPPPWEANLPIAKVTSGLSATDPACVHEVGRDATSVVWRNPDGSFASNMYSAPVNYKAADGSWQAIDTRLASDGQGGFTNKAGPFSVHFGSSAATAKLITLTQGAESISLGFGGALKVSSGTVAPTPTAGVVAAGSDTVTFSGALANTDLRYQVLPDGIKEAIVLNKALAATVTPQFEFTVGLSGLTAQTASDGTIQFVDSSTQKVAFAIPAGLATDAAGATTPVQVQLMPSADPSVATIVVSVVSTWLSDPSRVFPVTIDPSLNNQTATSDAYVYSSSPNTNCGSCQYNGTTYVDKAGTSSGVTYRTFLQYPSLSALSGDDILSANWYGYAYNHAGTPPFSMTMQPPSASWSSSTVTWNNQPAVRTNSTSFSYSGSPATGWYTDGITGFVQGWTASSSPWGQYGIRLAGPTTGLLSIYAQPALTDTSYINVTFDAYPTLSNLSAGGIYTPESTPSTQPILSAQIASIDAATGLTGNFQLWNSAQTTMLQSGTGTSVGTGQNTQWQVGTALSAGTYSWRVDGTDGTATSAWSAWQTLIINQTPPNTPTITISGLTLNTWNTSGGSSATATFGDTSTDMYGFEWGLDVGSNPTTPVAWNPSIPGATVTFSPTWGWHDLAVRAIDLAGNLSTTVQHFTFGWGLGGFSAPQTGSTTQGEVVAQVNTTTSYTGMSMQWRAADTDSWADIPTGDVTYQSSGLGIGSWPVTATPGTYSTVFPNLVWNAASTLAGIDGPIQLRAGFDQSGTYTYLTDTPSIPLLTLDQADFGSGSDSAGAGPGAVNLLTGDLELNATDVSLPGGSIARTFQSRNATASGGPFGPGWTSNIGGSPAYQSLTTSATADAVVVTEADGTELDFAQTSNSALPYTYASPPSDANLALTETSSGFSLADVSGVVYTFTNTSGDQYMPATVTDASGQTYTTTWTVNGGITEPTLMTAPPPPTVNCASAPLTTRGCETMTFDYATTTQSTSLCGGTLGDYAGQLRDLKYYAWDPDTSAMNGGVAVANYCYDSTGMLREEWDPRLSSNPLITQYSYNSNGQIATLTPPGVNAWNFTYAPLSGEPAGTGRLSTVYRAEISPLGNATTAYVYQIPLTTSGGGPYNLDPTTTSTWAQQDNPTNATAIYPPDQTPSGSPPSSYTRATVYYLDPNALLVNLAQPGGYITTSEYDNFGNVIRTLSAANRQRALASSTNTAWEAALAKLFSTTNIYDSTDVNLVDTYGPVHMVNLPDGTQRLARQHGHYTYDQGSPGGATYDLVTTETDSATPVDGSAEQDTRTATAAYNIGADTSGWTLGTPLQTTVDPGTGSHLNLTTTSKYDTTTGNLTARILPANPSGGDAHETDLEYYTADGSAHDLACRNHPEWAGMPCYTAPAAQPGTTGLPNLATTQVTKYNVYGEPETTVDTNGTDNRTTTIGYDAAGRQTSQSVTGTSGAGTSLPTITTQYDTSTGLSWKTSDGTLTITRTYDALGRPSTYQDADGNTSTYTYDLLDRISTLNDGKNTATYTYDDVGGEERGLPTTINYGSSIGSFTATYDADGNLATQTYPGGPVATYTYDQTGETTSLVYTDPGHSGSWPTDSAQYNIHGEIVSDNAWAALNDYTYDAAGRLTQDSNPAYFVCNITNNYTYDADTNRTQNQLVDGCPGYQATTNFNSTYDSADRSTLSGYSYDDFGRTTAVPAADSTTGNADTLTYYVNDLVDTIANNGTTVTHNLDPNERLRTFVSSAAPTVTHTDHYAGDGDSPAWTSEVTAGTTWTEWLHGFNGMAATVNQAGTVTNQFADIHGDLYGSLASTDTNPNDATYMPNDAWGNPLYSGLSRYDYVGSAERKRDTNSSLILMGARVYNSYSGRFLQTDPVLGGSANSYDYAGADPVNKQDLSGSIATPVWVDGPANQQVTFTHPSSSVCTTTIFMGPCLVYTTITNYQIKTTYDRWEFDYSPPPYSSTPTIYFLEDYVVLLQNWSKSCQTGTPSCTTQKEPAPTIHSITHIGSYWECPYAPGTYTAAKANRMTYWDDVIEANGNGICFSKA